MNHKFLSKEELIGATILDRREADDGKYFCLITDRGVYVHTSEIEYGQYDDHEYNSLKVHTDWNTFVYANPFETHKLGLITDEELDTICKKNQAENIKLQNANIIKEILSYKTNFPDLWKKALNNQTI